MIEIQLARLLKRKGKTLYWLSQESGVRWPTLAKMAKGKTERLELEVLDRVCEVLTCEPGDLLVRVERRKARRK